jgi:hypothetical protein
MTNKQKLNDTIEQAEENIAKASEGLEGANKSKEKEVVFLRDFTQYENVMREYRCGDVFFCPKCDSSIICLCDEYANNNITNSMNQDKPDNLDFKKIVLECGNCKYKDILIKFLKTFEHKNIIYNEGLAYPSKPRRNRYYSPLMTTTGGITK